MKDSTFLKGIKRLEAAFRTEALKKATLKIYFEKLKAADDETFLSAIERAVEEDHFFPSIARLIYLCDLQTRYDAAGRELTIL